MNAHTYSINTDVKFAPLELIDVGQLAADCQQQWFNQTLCRVNDAVTSCTARGRRSVRSCS
jgi:hypothetical protein